MRVAIYIRVSTTDQAREGFSIPAQRERLTLYANAQEWDIYDYFIDDGYSAKDTNRPAFQRLMRDAEQRNIDVILVHKLDRFTRSVKDLYEVLEKLSKYNVSFRSSLEQFDTTTTMGRAMIGMLGIFAQWERETIADRVYWGMEQKIISGKRNGAPPPMGYDLVDGELVINDDADFVRRLFALYLSGKGMPTITEILHKEGRDMHIKTLWYILKNPVYCGKYRWNWRSKGLRTNNEIVAGEAPAIISVEDFDRVQDMIKSRDKKGRSATSEYIFSGLARCGRCGSFLHGGIRHNQNNDVLFYRCSGRVQYGKCDLPRIREESMIEALFQRLEALVQNKDKLAEMYEITHKKNPSRDIAKLNKELEQVRKRREKWRQAFANELISMEELRSYNDKEKARENELIEEIDEIKRSSETTMSVEDIHKLLRDIPKVFAVIDTQVAKKLFLGDVFTEMVFNTDAVKPRPGRSNEYGCHIESWKLKE